MFQPVLHLLLAISFGLMLFGFSVHDPEGQNREDIQAVLRGVTAAWEDGDTAAFRKYYFGDKGVRMIDGRVQNVGISDFIRHHMLPYHEELAELDIAVRDTEIHFLNGYTNAWTIQDFDVRVKTRAGEETNATGYATYILQRFNGKWKIVHSHSSTHRWKLEGKQ